jgi:hypothetical protein
MNPHSSRKDPGKEALREKALAAGATVNHVMAVSRLLAEARPDFPHVVGRASLGPQVSKIDLALAVAEGIAANDAIVRHEADARAPRTFELGERFVLVLRMNEADFRGPGSVREVLPYLHFLPTDFYPNLWFRFGIDDGSKLGDGSPARIYFEYNFAITERDHDRLLREMVNIGDWTLVYAGEKGARPTRFDFRVDAARRELMAAEVAACAAGARRYRELSLDGWRRGQVQIAQAVAPSGGSVDRFALDVLLRRRDEIEPKSRMIWEG